MASNTRPDSAELKQRVRRLLSSVRSIAVHMAAQDQESLEAALHLVDRVGAIGRAALAPMLDGMDLESLVLDELQVRRVRRAALVVSGPVVRLKAKSAELMTLIVHELATNAIKFGALSQSQTRLRVVWWLIDIPSPRLHFEWAEDGVRMGSGSDRKPGFGSELVTRRIASVLNGKGAILFLREGMLCTIEIPADEALH